MKKKVYWINPRLPDDEYNRQWIAGVKERCEFSESGCWLWTKFCHTFRNIKPGQRGYPGGSYRGNGCRVHRKMLELKLGRILPPHLQACHTCDTPHCVNPDHLYAATNKQNHIDGGKRKRMQGQTKTHCVRGHEFTPDNIMVHYDTSGASHRRCKTCDLIRQRIRAGWPRELAEKLPPGKIGQSWKQRFSEKASASPEGNCEHGIPRRFCTAVHL